MFHRLNVEELSVETFDPNFTAQLPMQDPTVAANPGIDWTGCDSACTECGAVLNQF